MTEEATETQNVADLPEWAQQLIKETRAEAARYRTENKSLTGRITELESESEELKATIQLTDETVKNGETELQTERFARTRDRLAFERGLPLDVAELVSASDEETLTSALDALAALRGAPGSGTEEKVLENPAQTAEPVLDEQSQKEEFARQIFQID